MNLDNLHNQETVEVLQDDIDKIYKMAILGKITVADPNPENLYTEIGIIVSKYRKVQNKEN